eukprot:6184692-Pleurochrysis_carterae.AAC.2
MTTSSNEPRRAGKKPSFGTMHGTSLLAAHVEEDARAGQTELELSLDHDHLILASRLPGVAAASDTETTAKALCS